MEEKSNFVNNFDNQLINNGKNKIRVVVRMRPYLAGEEEELRTLSDV
jgi:hypothetical protein